ADSTTPPAGADPSGQEPDRRRPERDGWPPRLRCWISRFGPIVTGRRDGASVEPGSGRLSLTRCAQGLGSGPSSPWVAASSRGGRLEAPRRSTSCAMILAPDEPP